MPPAFRGQAAVRPVLTDLVVPLATLLGLAERPGEGHGLGVLDPDLCRDLAALAAASPHTRLCVTVTGPGGIAIGHGCGRPHKPASAPPGQLSANAPGFRDGGLVTAMRRGREVLYRRPPAMSRQAISYLP